MTEILTNGCPLRCTFGMAPSVFQTLNLPGKPVILNAFSAGIATDIAPGVNIPPFGMCQSLSNPTVASATSAAMGVLTPMPCVPVVAQPWAPTDPIMTWNGVALATVKSKCLCVWGGEISVQAPMEMLVQGQ